VGRYPVHQYALSHTLGTRQRVMTYETAAYRPRSWHYSQTSLLATKVSADRGGAPVMGMTYRRNTCQKYWLALREYIASGVADSI
jgi:hypothetical protein